MTLHNNMYNNMSDPSRRILKSLLQVYLMELLHLDHLEMMSLVWYL